MRFTVRNPAFIGKMAAIGRIGLLRKHIICDCQLVFDINIFVRAERVRNALLLRCVIKGKAIFKKITEWQREGNLGLTGRDVNNTHIGRSHAY